MSAKISLKFVPKGPIDNIPAWVQIMAWHRPGDKPLSEPMMVRLPTHICVTRPQWVKLWWHLSYIDGLVQERRNSIAYTLELRLFCTKPSIWMWYSVGNRYSYNSEKLRSWSKIIHMVAVFRQKQTFFMDLTHWGRVTHICVNILIIIGSDNGLSPDQRQAIIWTNDRLSSIGPLRTYFNENLIKIQQFSLKKMHVKMASAKWRPSCLGLNVLSDTDDPFQL